MLTVTRSAGASSTADKMRKGAQKGEKGRLELFASRSEDGNATLTFVDYGNYGKERWSANFGPLTTEQINEMVDALIDFRDGEVETTHLPFEVEAQGSEPTPDSDESAPAVETSETTRGESEASA